MSIVRIRTKESAKKIWLMIIADSREIYNLDEVLCHSKLSTKQTCDTSGMGMTKPLGVRYIEFTTYHDIRIGLENKCLVYIELHSVDSIKLYIL